MVNIIITVLHMGVSELTNDPGARNNSGERVNGALHELDMSTNRPK